ncbi:hypothetical protein RB2150_10244 [Rhodobacterales bacterium HTCC2150]|nr:hypothetical protein RB2150_10244 [Rhodobacterales bacterium HTCC2150] [Rhodobacteraceae bacterium HTCC2150]
MQVNFSEIQLLLEEIDQRLQAFYKKYAAEGTERFNKKNEHVGVLRYNRNLGAFWHHKTAIECKYFHKHNEDQLSNHQKIELHHHRDELIRLGATLADLLCAIPALDHPDFWVTVYSHQPKTRPRIKMEIEGLLVHDRMLQIPSLVKKLKVNLGRLTPITPSRVHDEWTVSGDGIFASSAANAVFKWVGLKGITTNGEMIEFEHEASKQRWFLPEVKRVIPKLEFQEELKALSDSQTGLN